MAPYFRTNLGTMQGFSRSGGKYFSMKKMLFVAMVLLGFSSIAYCDYKDENNVLTMRMQELAGAETEKTE